MSNSRLKAQPNRLRPRGDVQLRVVRQAPNCGLPLLQLILMALPAKGMSHSIAMWKLRNFHNIMRGLWKLALARVFHISHFEGALFLTVRRADGSLLDYGLASLRVITTAGVTEVATRFAGTSAASIANFKFHALGTGTNAEAIGDTALQTELTTEYNPDNTRATGSQSASTNTYSTTGTNTVDASAAVTEHGILTQAATGGGTLLDRSKFTVINLSSGDSLQSAYTLTLSAGG
jgi:hypothetical protein